MKLTVLLLTITLLSSCNGTPEPTPPVPQGLPNYEGFIDSITCDAIIAWGWDVNRPNDPINLDVYEGNTLLTTISASNFRKDLLDAKKGNGKHYGLILTPPQVKDGKKHLIVLKFGGTAMEVAPAKELICTK